MWFIRFFSHSVLVLLACHISGGCSFACNLEYNNMKREWQDSGKIHMIKLSVKLQTIPLNCDRFSVLVYFSILSVPNDFIYKAILRKENHHNWIISSSDRYVHKVFFFFLHKEHWYSWMEYPWNSEYRSMSIKSEER